LSDKISAFKAIDIHSVIKFQTIKGISFIFISSLIIFFLVHRDAKKRIVLLKELTEEKNYYLTLFESANDAIFIIKEGQITDCNRQATHMFAQSKKKMINSPFLIIFPEFQPNGIISESLLEQNIELARIAGRKKLEWKLLKPDGKEFFSEMSLNILGDGNNSILMAIVSDVDERKKAEKKLFENQLLIQRITEQSPDIIYIYDVEQNKNIYTNKNLGLLLGYSADEYPKNSSEFFSKFMHPQDSKQFDDYEQFIMGWEQEFVFSYEYRLKAQNGNWLWFSGHEKEFQRENGKIISIIGAVRNISEKKIAEGKLKKSEEKFYKIFNSNQALMTIYNTEDLRRIDVNEAFTQISGYHKDEIPGKLIDEFNIIP
jgi:PAS domain S-box-containing protein